LLASQGTGIAHTERHPSIPGATLGSAFGMAEKEAIAEKKKAEEARKAEQKKLREEMVAKASESKKLEQGAMKKELTEDIMVTPKVTPKVTPVMTPILTPPNPFNFKEEAVVASSSQAPEEVLEPQEVRDERAREARNFFNKKDAEAKLSELFVVTSVVFVESYIKFNF